MRGNEAQRQGERGGRGDKETERERRVGNVCESEREIKDEVCVRERREKNRQKE